MMDPNGFDPCLGSCFFEEDGTLINETEDLFLSNDPISTAYPERGGTYTPDPSPPNMIPPGVVQFDVRYPYDTTKVEKPVVEAPSLQYSQNPIGAIFTPPPIIAAPAAAPAAAAPPVQPKEESFDDIENELKAFNTVYEGCGFFVEENRRNKSKQYYLEDNCIIAKPGTAVMIKLVGAQGGQFVKVSLRWKAEAHYQQPVLPCPLHKDLTAPNPVGTFQVVTKNNAQVRYVQEQQHPTALLTVPTLLNQTGFYFHPIFRCWNSCDKEYGKKQEIIFTLCDVGGEVLLETIFDLRVCQNIGRDTKEYCKGVKRLKKTPQKARKRGSTSREQQGGAMAQGSALVERPSTSRTHRFMVEVDVDLVPVLEALVNVRGKLIELDPAASWPESEGY